MNARMREKQKGDPKELVVRRLVDLRATAGSVASSVVVV